MSEHESPQFPGWEEICERCGRCCYEKIEYRGKILYTREPCPYLDTQTKLCRVYARRLAQHPECTRLTPELARSGILPDDCPYVRRFAEQSRGPRKK